MTWFGVKMLQFLKAMADQEKMSIMKIHSKILIIMSNSKMNTFRNSQWCAQRRNVDFFINVNVFEIICTNLDFANVEGALGSQKRHIVPTMLLQIGPLYQWNTKWLQQLKNQVMIRHHMYLHQRWKKLN